MITSTQVVKQNTPALEQRIVEIMQTALIAATKAYGETLDARVNARVDAQIGTRVSLMADVKYDELHKEIQELNCEEIHRRIQEEIQKLHREIEELKAVQTETPKIFTMSHRIKILFTGRE